MINAEELLICRRRGHNFSYGETPSPCAGWKQCRSCGMWLRHDAAIREREDVPPESEIHPLVPVRRSKSAQLKAFDAGELAICRLRRHKLGDAEMAPHHGWAQCGWCGVWVREERTITEREEDPPEAELSK